MSFSRGFQLTFGLLLVGSFLKLALPTFYNTIVGNAIITSSLFIAFTFLTIKQDSVDTQELFPKIPVSRKIYFIIVLATISMYLPAWLIMEIEVLLKNGLNDYLLKNNEIFAWSSRLKFFLTSLIVSPIVEELFFRGLLLSSFKRRYDNTKAILFSSLLFGMSHLKMDATFVSAFVDAFLSGCLFGWIFVTTQNIRASIFAHFFWNILVYLFPFTMFHSAFKIESLSTFVLFGIGIVVFSMLIGFIGIKLYRDLRRIEHH